MLVQVSNFEDTGMGSCCCTRRGIVALACRGSLFAAGSEIGRRVRGELVHDQQETELVVAENRRLLNELLGMDG